MYRLTLFNFFLLTYFIISNLVTNHFLFSGASLIILNPAVGQDYCDTLNLALLLNYPWRQLSWRAKQPILILGISGSKYSILILTIWIRNAKTQTNNAKEWKCLGTRKWDWPNIHAIIPLTLNIVQATCYQPRARPEPEWQKWKPSLYWAGWTATYVNSWIKIYLMITFYCVWSIN